MRARKKFVVIAYDVASTRRRNKVVKAVIKYGGRINLSVFECMLTDSQLAALEKELEKLIAPETDQIAIYLLCLDCYARIKYLPVRKTSHNEPITVV